MSEIHAIRVGFGTGDSREMPASIDRRRFSAAAVLAFLVGATITIGCGGGSSSSPTAPTTPPPVQATGDINGVVSANHDRPHFAVITRAQLNAGAALTLDVSNGSHGHSLSLTSTQVTQIAGGARVSQNSSRNPHSDGSDPHDHLVTFN